MPPRMLLPRLGTAYRMPVVPRFLSSEHTLAGGTGERPPCPLPYIRTCFLAFFQELIRPTGPSGDTLPDCRRACTLSPRACGSTLGQDGLPRGAASGFPTLASTTPLSVARARSGRRDNCSSGRSRSGWRSNSSWHRRRSRWPHRRSWWASAAAAAGAAAAHAVELHVPQRHRPSTGQRPHPITLSRHVCLTRGGIRPFVGMPGLSGRSNARRSASRVAAPFLGGGSAPTAHRLPRPPRGFAQLPPCCSAQWGTRNVSATGRALCPEPASTHDTSNAPTPPT